MLFARLRKVPEEEIPDKVDNALAEVSHSLNHFLFLYQILLTHSEYSNCIDWYDGEGRC